MRRLDRRDLLASTARAATTGALLAAAGCLSDPETGGTATPEGTAPPDGTATATERTPTIGEFAVADWLPTPAAVGAGDHYGFAMVEPAALAPHAEALGRDYYEELTTGPVIDLLDLDPERVRTHLAFQPASVVEAPFDPEAVVASLEDAGLERDGSHEGFDVHGGDEATVAVGPDLLVVDRSGGDPAAALEPTIDAGLGAAERYRAASDAAGEILARLDDGQLQIGTTRDPPEETSSEHGRFAGNTGLGYEVTVEGDATTLRLLHTFASADEADPDAVREWVDVARTGSVLDNLEGDTVEADGPVVELSGTIGTDDVPGSGLGGFFVSTGEEVEENVQAGASVRVDDEADTIEVTWTSNQNADHLSVRFDPSGGEALEERIEEVGGSATYEGADGETVQVTVKAHGEERSTVILDRRAEL